MKTLFFATLRQITKVNESTEFQADSVKELLNKLCDFYGVRFADWVWAGDQLSDAIIILVNGRSVEHLDGIETKLSASDEIAIFPKLAGG